MRYAWRFLWLCILTLPTLVAAEPLPCAPAPVVYPFPVALPDPVLLPVSPVVGLRWTMAGPPQLLDVQRRSATQPDEAYTRVATIPGLAYADGWGLMLDESYCYRVCRTEAGARCSNTVCVRLCAE
jgi:hypothetical protein